MMAVRKIKCNTKNSSKLPIKIPKILQRDDFMDIIVPQLCRQVVLEYHYYEKIFINVDVPVRTNADLFVAEKQI